MRRQFRNKEEMEVFIKDGLGKLKDYSSPSDYVNGLMEFAQQLHSSDAYQIIKNYIVPKKNQMIIKCKSDDIATYQKFQDYYFDECKKSFDHDNACATNYQVDQAVTRAYSIAVRMIGKSATDNEEKFNTLLASLNKIEEHLGIELTKFEEDNKDDNAKQSNEQRDKEIS